MLTSVSTSTQLFYAWRIYALGRSLTTASSIVVVSLVCLVGTAFAKGGQAIACTNRSRNLGVRRCQASWKAHHRYVSLEMTLYASTRHSFTIFVVPILDKDASIVRLAGTAICDIIIALSMIVCLNRSRIRTNGHLSRILAKLIRLTLETGFLCAIMAVLDLVFLLVYPKTTYHTVTALILSKLYSNSLLSVSISSDPSNIQTENVPLTHRPLAFEYKIPHLWWTR